MLGTVQTGVSGNKVSLLQLSCGINEDMVRNGFWPENKSDRNYAEAVALIIGELCVEGKDALTNGIPLESKDSIVEEIADAAIRHLDLMAGLGIAEEFTQSVALWAGGDPSAKDITLEELVQKVLSVGDNVEKDLCKADYGYEFFCCRAIYYPLLASVEVLRKTGTVLSNEMLLLNANAFGSIFTLGMMYEGFIDRLLKKVEYNRTRSYRHGKTF